MERSTVDLKSKRNEGQPCRRRSKPWVEDRRENSRTHRTSEAVKQSTSRDVRLYTLVTSCAICDVYARVATAPECVCIAGAFAVIVESSTLSQWRGYRLSVAVTCSYCTLETQPSRVDNFSHPVIATHFRVRAVPYPCATAQSASREGRSPHGQSLDRIRYTHTCSRKNPRSSPSPAANLELTAIPPLGTVHTLVFLTYT